MKISDELDAQIKAERQREIASLTGPAARRARLGTRPANPADCPQGHPYDDENTLRTGTGRRMCLSCIADRRIYTHGECAERYKTPVRPQDGHHVRAV